MKNIPLYEVRPISTLKDMLESSARLYADKAAFLVKTEEGGSYKPITFEQYLNDVNALGTALISLGLSGKRVAIISENRYEWTVAYLAVVNGTGVVVPLDKDLPAAEIKNLLLRSKADAVFYSGAKKNEVETIASELPNLQYLISLDDTQSNGRIVSYKSLMEKGFELVNGGDRRFIDAKVDREGMSILLFTSGTTDKAKAVMLSHKNVCSILWICAPCCI